MGDGHDYHHTGSDSVGNDKPQHHRFIRKALKTNPFNNPFKESTPAAIQPADATTASANADEEDKSSDEKAEIPLPNLSQACLLLSTIVWT